MRLIDKDFILKTAKDKEWGLWCEIVNIKFAPEVDAIPVEWLLDRAQECLIDRDITASEMKFIKKLIEEWRSLNG